VDGLSFSNFISSPAFSARATFNAAKITLLILETQGSDATRIIHREQEIQGGHRACEDCNPTGERRVSGKGQPAIQDSFGNRVRYDHGQAVGVESARSDCSPNGCCQSARGHPGCVISKTDFVSIFAGGLDKGLKLLRRHLFQGVRQHF
jgi:hypothetical protein